MSAGICPIRTQSIAAGATAVSDGLRGLRDREHLGVRQAVEDRVADPVEGVADDPADILHVAAGVHVEVAPPVALDAVGVREERRIGPVHPSIP